MKTLVKLSRWFTSFFLVAGFGICLAYVIVNLNNGGRTTSDVIGWIIFDFIVFGAIILGMFRKKARPLVDPALICLVSINLAINIISPITATSAMTASPSSMSGSPRLTPPLVS
jgi:hypothetical protein